MPANKAYVFYPAAWEELEAADEWYRQRSPEASVRFLSAVYDGLEKLARRPGSWPTYLSGTRRYILYRFPFSIIYLETFDAIQVIAVAHHRRKPGYWRQRL
jgi:toxin ParE1/3/4